MNCPICQRRKPVRFCPARGESICSICCGTEREVTLDCPADCIYLIRAREQEEAQRKPIPHADVPFPEIELPTGVLDLNRELVAALATTILGYAAKTHGLVDQDVAATLRALSETFRTLTSGLYYEKPPEGGPSRELYGHLRETVEALRKEQLGRGALPIVKDSDALYVAVFLARILRSRSNRRPKCRAFLDFLHAQFPPVKGEEKEAPRIIVP
jgi:hypothetical protein